MVELACWPQEEDKRNAEQAIPLIEKLDQCFSLYIIEAGWLFVTWHNRVRS